ncbi:MAG: hypothetical protein IJF60_05370 [Agathobacter sp.]|nr:hypothetical protein [Agathobacter sp.]
MSAKTKIVVVKLKDILFYTTVAVLGIIMLLLLFILFQPDTAPTSSTISVKAEHFIEDYQPHGLNQA